MSQDVIALLSLSHYNPSEGHVTALLNFTFPYTTAMKDPFFFLIQNGLLKGKNL